MQDIKRGCNRFCFKACFVIFWLITCPPVWGQDGQKRFLTKEDYALWSKLYIKKISDHGNWVSYTLKYDSKEDTLFVKSTTGGITYPFPKVSDGIFSGENQFACITGDTLVQQDLNSGTRTKTAGVYQFFFSQNQKYLAMLKKQAAGIYILEIQDKNRKTLEQISDVTQWYFDPDCQVIVYSTRTAEKYSVSYIQLDKAIAKRTIVSNSSFPFQNFVYKKNTIAFVQTVTDHPLLLRYAIDQDRLHQLDPARQQGFPSGMTISDELTHRLTLSDDGRRVFFRLAESKDISRPIDLTAVEIWNTQDRLLFDYKKYLGDLSKENKMAVWSPEENTMLQITDSRLPAGFVNAASTHAFIYDSAAYEPQSKDNGPFDLYIVDLQTGKRKCILEKYSSRMIPAASPDGLHLCYAQDGDLWIYDIKKDTHTNITAGLPDSFFKEDSDMPEDSYPYGIEGWSKDGKSIIAYDAFDLWQLNVDGSVKKRVTHGREIKRTYRIKNAGSGPYDSKGTSDMEIPDAADKMLLEIKDRNSGVTGFCHWNAASGLSDIVWNNTSIEQLYKAADSTVYTYVEQRYDMPPKLMLYRQSPKEIFQSNKQQQKFWRGNAGLIQYTVNGKNMQALLYYPAGYIEGAVYPMVVYIYQRQSQHITIYEAPTLYSPEGFSIANYTAQGYLVLLPDMAYELGKVAASATESVLAAVDAVIAKGLAEPGKIGLIGHSFGGYEAGLIITQTDRFATAVSGSGWTDLVSSYLFINSGFKKPEYFRAEDDQIRIGKSLYEDPQSYLQNSPVLLAAAIKTPLLGWTGKEDPTVHPLQSMEFYMALRRLNKTHTLLVYPEEGHFLLKKENQKDLSERIQQWFDYYLKNGRIQPWMKSDN
jgi:dipeptidyl aminopeptidase/acylaminoacyl peptidase